MKDDLIREILTLEWEMFTNVQNQGGTASCQQDPKTFAVMRTSQALSWSIPMLDSYLEDLKSAKAAGRNLMTEKYARMMADTHPDEYRQIAHLLPPIEAEAQGLVSEITDLMLRWADETQKRYPKIGAAGRNARFSGDGRGTSLETYFRGELLTYSLRTLSLSRDFYVQNHQRGWNGYEAVLENTVRMYGYQNLEEAEKNQ